MTNYITLGGDQHPINFSNAVQVIYQRQFGRSMQGDFLKVANGATALMSGDTSQPFAEELTNLAFVGIYNGYRIQGGKMPLDVLDIADMLLGDEKAIGELITLYAESLPKPSTDEAEKKTKPGATPAMKVAAKLT